MTRLWLLGAEDPEMLAIAELLTVAGETVEYATAGGKPVHPGNAYQADAPDLGEEVGTLYLVECGLAPTATAAVREVRRIDHHNPGDPGHGRPPEEFLPASSIGQVVAELARMENLPEDWGYLSAAAPSRPGEFLPPSDDFPDWLVGVPIRPSGADYAVIPDEVILTAAADHCLAAALQGACPDVKPDDLMAFLARRDGYEGEIEAARKALEAAPRVEIGGLPIVDLRGLPPPSLPRSRAVASVAGMAGVGYISLAPKREGERPKVVIGGCGAGTVPGTAPVVAFLGGWAASQGLVEPYGDSVRGFAGAYLP
jgi:hypothetical protein